MAAYELSQVGNHFFVGLQPSPKLTDKDKELLEALRPAGVVLFKSNFVHDVDYDSWLENHRRLINDIKEAVGRDRFLIATDHEGGRVCRTPNPITRFRSAAQWPHAAAQIGEAMGRELASLGLNMNFAPVLDVDSNPDNPVIGDRAFGSSPQGVGESGAAFTRAIQSQNVWACGKHFPGHGDTDVDSHHALPVLNLDRAQLNERELVPFDLAIRAGLELMMTAHIMFPKIDPDLPATLSKTVTTGLLRETLGFEGVVLSDDIGMHAMDGYFADGSAARQFMEAGNDVIMVCAHFTDTDRALRLAASLVDELADDGFAKSFHEPSKERVDGLLSRTVMHDVCHLNDDVFATHREIAGVYEAKTVEVV
ncbi:MAG: glycoside hydrolase family 3 protein [Ahrensia sp.]|nr:glycoside hydrolase family 3 protein [Ahrensia sp.]